MANLDIYEAARFVPREAKRDIPAGKLKGKTDINPMWRIKKLTELFGACGVGWYTETTKQWVYEAGDGTAAVFTNINLYVRCGAEWSKPIEGTGGNKVIAKEREGLVLNDEAYKMSETDAISVACKKLGIGADVYWGEDATKYTEPTVASDDRPQELTCSLCGSKIMGVVIKGTQFTAGDLVERSEATYGRRLCYTCMKAEKTKKAEGTT